MMTKVLFAMLFSTVPALASELFEVESLERGGIEVSSVSCHLESRGGASKTIHIDGSRYEFRNQRESIQLDTRGAECKSYRFDDQRGQRAELYSVRVTIERLTKRGEIAQFDQTLFFFRGSDGRLDWGTDSITENHRLYRDRNGLRVLVFEEKSHVVIFAADFENRRHLAVCTAESNALPDRRLRVRGSGECFVAEHQLVAPRFAHALTFIP